MLSFILPRLMVAQDAAHRLRETGIPYIRNFSPKEYGMDPHNYAVVQDRRGIMYVANLGAVLEYDGISWKRIKPARDTWVLSLARDSLGTIFVGCLGDFGCLAPDSSGTMTFVSLLDHVPEQHRDFAEVWRIHATRAAVYFWTRNKIFRWSGKKMKVWKSRSAFALSSAAKDTLYVEERGSGLLKMNDDSLKIVQTQKGTSPSGIVSVLSYDNKSLLVCSLPGLFLFDGEQFLPFGTDINEFLRANTFSSAVSLPKGDFAIATYKGGVRIINREGTTTLALNAASGLQSDDVKNMYCDAEGVLWLALNSGISYARTNDPLTHFTEAQGLKGNVVSIVKRHESIYCATSQGIFRMVFPDMGAQYVAPRFEQVAGISGEAFWLLPAGDVLLAATASPGGVYVIQGSTSSLISSKGQDCFVLCRSKLDTNRIYVGRRSGVEILQRSGALWTSTGQVKGMNTTTEVRSIAENTDGSLWAGTLGSAALRVKLVARDTDGWNAVVERFGRSDGLPEGPVNVTALHGAAVFTTYKGHRQYDEGQRRFLPDTSVSAELADTTLSASVASEDRFGSIYAFVMDKQGTPELWRAMPQHNGSYMLSKNPFRSLGTFGLFYSVYTDDTGVIWIGCSTGLVRYDPFVSKNYDRDFAALIRGVATLRAL